MATRKIVRIDEQKCNGCGECITGCAEGALELVDGKAKLVKETFCDGFGDCIGVCPTGALVIEEREADEYDPEQTREHVGATRGDGGIAQFDAASQAHSGRAKASGGACPGVSMRFGGAKPSAAPAKVTGGSGQAIRSELDQWPIQLHLVQPNAPFFKNRELVVLSTCSPVACPDVHWRFIRGRSLVVACPKLDRTDGYVDKLAAILSEPSIPKVHVVRMVVPCCGGLTAIVKQAVQQSGRTDLAVAEATVSLEGDVL